MILDDVKEALRLDGNDLDTEVQDLIEASKADLLLAGINTVDETKPLIKRAIELYCKAQFGYDNADAERFQKSYDLLKIQLLLTNEYGGGTA